MSLIYRGCTLRVNKSLADLTYDNSAYSYSWGFLRSYGSTQHSLSPKTGQADKIRLDDAPVLNTKASETPAEYRNFMMATIDDSTLKFIAYCHCAGIEEAPTASESYAGDYDCGSISISTDLTKHEDSAFLNLAEPDGFYYDSK